MKFIGKPTTKMADVAGFQRIVIEEGELEVTSDEGINDGTIGTELRHFNRSLCSYSIKPLICKTTDENIIYKTSARPNEPRGLLIQKSFDRYTPFLRPQTTEIPEIQTQQVI